MAYRLPSSEKTIQLLWLCFFISNLLDLAHADPPYKACSNNSANSQFQKQSRDYLKTRKLSCGKKYANCATRNQNFLGHLDVSGNDPLDNKEDLENPAQFILVVNETLNDLTKQVAFNSSTNMYATREAAFTNTDTLASRGGRVLSRSCYLRYELYAWYEGANETSKSPPVPGKSNRRTIWIIIILTVAAALLVVGILGYLIYCHAMRNGRKKWERQNTRIDRNCRGIGHPNHDDYQLQNFHRDGVNDGESAFMDLETINAATDNVKTYSDSRTHGAWELWNEGKELELIDPLLADSCCSDEFSRYMNIGLLCVQEDPCERPTMSSVVSMMKSESSILTQPHRPAFSVGRLPDFEANASNCSASVLTISGISPR
ncbi:CYSTEINE-RICH RECEPTOR-LIKE KINASE [Salix koriyanagi]|uniref:CYSTEINE-RICH RECEPTOR-LIKE KINASE n=1 Tax=Salix koriyanagi TaxID=2511006 RepID=A0A9Q0ZBU5_9ROSI|nr:CYSTEINE-RICH RECEPTOR-LIKE KINASE [Salix koriyanagi]